MENCMSAAGSMHHSHEAIQLVGVLGFWTFGLVTSLHCAGMCGPISLAFSEAKHGGISFANIALYHLSRVVSYALVGAGLGWLGGKLHVGGIHHLVGWLVVGSLVLFALGVSLPQPRLMGKLKMVILSLFPKDKRLRAVIIGIFSPLLPCGMLYAALAASMLAESLAVGALWMSAFALGTIPLLFLSQCGVRLLGNVLPGRRRLALRAIALTGGVLFAYLQYHHMHTM
jgi:sulfite exporter TauE/SafE